MRYVVSLRIPNIHEESVMEFGSYDDAKKHYDDLRERFIDSALGAALNPATVAISQVIYFSERK